MHGLCKALTNEYACSQLELPIKDTLNKGHLCVKDAPIQYILPPKEDNHSIVNKITRPNVSVYVEVLPVMP